MSKVLESFSNNFSKILLTVPLLCVMSCPHSYAQSSDDDTIRFSTQNKIQNIFNNIELIGNNYNSDGSSAAEAAMLDSGCRAVVEQLLQSALLTDTKQGYSQGQLSIPDLAREYVANKYNELGEATFNNFCAALKGENSGTNIDPKNSLLSDVLPRLVSLGQTLGEKTGIPFLSSVEVQAGVSDRSLISSITSIQPLWEDPTNQHHLFGQISWYDAETNKTDSGYNKYYDTLNAGLAYRYLTPDQHYLYGANLFLDHAPKMNHTRMSVGIDARTSQLALSANRYFPLSDWRQLDLYYEERAAAGWDLLLRGQVPELPSWTASIKGYEWDSGEDGAELYGYVGSVEYSPISVIAMSVGLRDDTEETPSVEAALRLKYSFDQPQDIQFRAKKELTPVADYVYEKVQRENIIRVTQRRREESKLTVVQTIGSNIVSESSGSSALSVGKSLFMPVTVSVSNTSGDLARLRFSDSSTLTIAQNSQVKIEPNIITLISGAIQYVNYGVITTIMTPGGTIELHGTDVDVVSNGTNSSIRVRDGQVNFAGNSGGSLVLNAAEAAEVVSGVASTLAPGSADYITHTDTISSEIDRVASPLTGTKVTPYPYEAPRVISNDMTVGGEIVLGLRFNDSLTVSGGVPRLLFTINGNSRVANYVSGSGTNDLRFSYTNVNADISATSLTVMAFDNNGATIGGNGMTAVTTIADSTAAVTGTGPTGIRFVGSTYGDIGSGGGPLTVSLSVPSGFAAGDVLIYTMSSDGCGTITWPTGFTQLHYESASYDWQCWGVAYKVATVSETTLDVTDSSTYGISAALLVYTGTDTTTPIDVSTSYVDSSQSNLPNAMTASTLTPNNNGAMLVWFGTADTDGTVSSLDGSGDCTGTTTSITPPSGYTERVDIQGSTGNFSCFSSIGIADYKQTTATATGSVSGVMSSVTGGASVPGAILIALKPQ